MVLTIGVWIQFYKKREIYIYMRKWDMFKLERLSI